MFLPSDVKLPAPLIAAISAMALILAAPILHAAEGKPAVSSQAVSTPRVLASPVQRELQPGEIPFRIAVLDLQRVARESVFVERAMKSAEDEMRKMGVRVETEVQEIRRLQANLKRQRALLDAEEIKKREDEILEREDDLAELQFRARRLARDAETKVIEPILEEILNLAGAYAEEEGFDIVLRADSILFANERADISQEVMNLLDERVDDLEKEIQKSNEAKAANQMPEAAPTPEQN
jgi:outer membrane protein